MGKIVKVKKISS